MEKVYYINHTSYKVGDVLKAWQFAQMLIQRNANIKKITFLVNTSQQFEFLKEIGIHGLKSASFNVKNDLGLEVQVRTIKTYHPNYVFAGKEPSEILIAIALNQEQLYKYEDMSDIAVCIIIPWMLTNFDSFLSIHECIDVDTMQSFPQPEKVDDKIINAIIWLKATSYPNEGFHHPNDSNRLKQVAKMLRLKKIPMQYDAIVHTCLQNGIIATSARLIADYFVGNRAIRLDEPWDKTWMMKVINGQCR